MNDAGKLMLLEGGLDLHSIDRHVVCSFYVERKEKALRQDCGPIKEPPPSRERYLAMLKVLDASCRRYSLEHVVLTDCITADAIAEAGLVPFMVDLPRNLMQATTEVHARWLASPHSAGCNTTFVGADCIIQHDFRPHVPASDLAVAFMRGHKKWRINNGFMHIPAASRERVAPIFRLIADDTGPVMCEDMIAVERALSPLPLIEGVFERRGIKVALLPLHRFNLSPHYMPEADITGAYVLHFMGGWASGKAEFFEHAERLKLA